MSEPILIDTDGGTDDAVAIMLLLVMEIKLAFKIKGIVCTNGNTNIDNVARNVLIMLESMDRTDIPVFRGAESSLLNIFKHSEQKFHGEDGFYDKEVKLPAINASEENAFAAIDRLAEEHKDLKIICLGPLTSVALALKTYPRLKERLGGLWIMGGNIHGIGNVEGTTAEFNFAVDPEAAYIVLSEAKCEKTMLPWEPCIDTPLSLEWRFQTVGGKKSKHMELLDLIEKDQYSKLTCWNPCDALLAVAFGDSKAINSSRSVNMRVELQGIYTRGQCALIDGKPNVRVIDSLNFPIIEQYVLELGQFGLANENTTATVLTEQS